MKKHFLIVFEKITGFTLAEVLITLTIIGVIAALTIPALMTNIQDAQYKTAWKKVFSDLNQATNMIKNNNGGTLDGFALDTMANVYGNYISNIKVCSRSTSEGCWHAGGTYYLYNGSLAGPDMTDSSNHNNTAKPGLVFVNGAMMFIYQTSVQCTSSYPTLTPLICGFAEVDTNGHTGPNMVGKDIYGIWITKDGILPAGTQNDKFYVGQYGYSSGYGKSAEYLYQ